MENRLAHKITQLKKSIDDFNKSLGINTRGMTPEVVDTIKSGQVQKFEIVVDLLWKRLKILLFEVNGIVANSPKQTIKEYFKIEACSYEDYEWLIEMIDMRNQLSHICSAERFEQIHTQIFKAARVINRISENINFFNP